MRLAGLFVAFFLLGEASSTVSAADHWPQFRGPSGQGHATASGVPLTWSESQGVAWKTPIPGRGWSSPVIEGDEIWLTTAVETPLTAEEKAERQKRAKANQPLTQSGPLSLRAIGLDRRTGQVLHDVAVLTEPEPQPVHNLNSFASPTPVLETGRLYCHFGTYGTACLDTQSRRVVWTNRDLKINHENGPGSSPILWGDKLIFHCDGSDKQFIVALDKHTGQIAWKTDRSGTLRPDVQMKKAYCTPLIVELEGRPQLISPAADWVYAYDPDSGRELWKLSYGVLGFSNVARPVAGHGLLYIVTCFMKSELLAVKVTNGKPEIAWRYDKSMPKMPSPLLVGNEIYLVGDQGGVVTCLDARTGEQRWQKRLGGNYAASPLLADGRIYLFSQEGLTTVLAPGPEYVELAKNQLEGQFMASAAALGKSLYLRTDRAIYRVE